MIHPNDTGPRTEFPSWLRWNGERCTVSSIIEPLREAGAQFRFEEVEPFVAELYIESRFYHFARSLIWWTAPAFVYVHIIPMEFTS